MNAKPTLTNRQPTLIIGYLLTLIFTITPAMGQDAVTVIPDISVTSGTGTEQAQRADTATVITQEDLEEKRSAVAFDVLENQPGLNVVRRLGMTGAGLSRLTIRGNGAVGPAGIQIFVDGRPDATVSFAHPTPSALGLAEVNHIEVIHGPSPVLHGSGKTGVVNIVTAKPEPGLHSHLELSYGGFSTHEHFGGVSYGGNDGYARLSFSNRGTDGDNPDSDADVESYSFKGSYQLNDVFNVAFTAARNEDSFEVFGSYFVPGPFTDPRTPSLDLTQTVLDLTLNANWDNLSSSLKFFTDELDPRSQFLDLGEERADVQEKGLRFKTIWSISRHTSLTAGIDYLEAQADNSPVPGPAPLLRVPQARVHEEIEERGIYAFINHALSDSTSISGGIRNTNHSEYGDVGSAEIGFQYAPEAMRGSTFRARATRGYQSPTLQQLFGIFRGGRRGPANAELDPEIIKQFEVGFNKIFTKGNFDLVAYTQKGEDLIQAPASPPPPPPDILNAIDYTNHGIEAKLHYALTGSINAMFGVTVSDFEHDTNRFLRVPEKTFDMGITYRHSYKKENDITASLFGRYADDTIDIPFGAATQVNLDSYFVADLKISYAVNNNAKIFFGIDNITDENYELVSGIPSPSRSVYGGVSLRY